MTAFFGRIHAEVGRFNEGFSYHCMVLAKLGHLVYNSDIDWCSSNH